MRRGTALTVVACAAALVAVAALRACDESGADGDGPASAAAGAAAESARVSEELATERAETRRLRGAVAALERRVAEMETRVASAEEDAPAAGGRGVDGDVAAREADEPTPEAWDELRRRVFDGAALPHDARRFWKRLAVLHAATLPAADPVQRVEVEADAELPDVWLSLDAPDARWEHAEAIADGARGGAARFAGPAARIDAGPCAVSPRRGFTVAAFLRTRSPDFATALMVRSDAAVGASLVVGREPGRVSFEAWSWESVKLVSTTRIDDGAWHEVEATYDPETGGALLFVDGRCEAAAVLGRGPWVAGRLRLGDNIGAEQPFAGDLDEVRILRRTTRRSSFGHVR